MSKISKNKLTKEVEELIWKRLVEVFRDAKSDTDVEKILNDLFTPSEKIIFGKRLSIAFFLNKGLSYQEISHILKVSSATIKSVRNTMRNWGRGYELITQPKSPGKLDRLLGKIFDRLEHGIRRSVRILEAAPRKSGGNRWRFLKEL